MKNLLFFLSAVALLAACNPQERLARQKHKYMEKSYVAIQKTIPEAQVSILNDTIKVLFPENLLFPIGKAELLPATIPLLSRFATALNEYDKTSILINGYTDNSGSESFNEKLSKERASNTRDVLKAQSVASERMFTWGRGDRNPIASNETLEGRQRNRRVEFIILYDYAPE